MKKCFLTIALAAICSISAFSQGITTANEFFKAVSDKYATFKDYQASVDITIDKKEMSATILYMAPDKMRMDFTVPAQQTIVYDGKKLICYLPDSASVLTQDAADANPTTSEGLSLLRRYYSVSYEKGQTAVPLDENSDEKVVKLILWRRSSSESFRYIKIAIDPDTKLIRRIIAVTPSGVVYQFDFKNYDINQGLSEKRFQYDIPSGANNYDNFLFSD
ncbi:LolA family protein [Treponema sp.]|uniref:LolA family protein n=1 Tax=Treponema sp. TaxID=166 RepID=UPI00298DBEC8|nr:outer-membrane lipoprotein carrier protein LolA [Treponema sp.]MCR5613868.1 outer-membrane lipoprotein carrier protein LolA [Treponema sp.]